MSDGKVQRFDVTYIERETFQAI